MGTKMSDNKGRQLTEVENRRQTGRRDPETVKSLWQLPDFFDFANNLFPSNTPSVKDYSSEV